MNNVYPESMNQLPNDNKAALDIIEKYIRYMCERTDFAMKHVVSAGGMNEDELKAFIISVAESPTVIEYINNNLNIPVNPTSTEGINIWLVD